MAQEKRAAKDLESPERLHPAGRVPYFEPSVNSGVRGSGPEKVLKSLKMGLFGPLDGTVHLLSIVGVPHRSLPQTVIWRHEKTW